jgi:1,4-dihydroxy-2-naphthoate octaprenyltransferase
MKNRIGTLSMGKRMRERVDAPTSRAGPWATAAIPPGSVAAWRIAARPKTLWIAGIPVIVATSLAWSLTGRFDPRFALVALVVAVLMQVVTNLQNDVGYTERGLENGERVGLPRATANGWLTIREVKRAIAGIIAFMAFVALPVVAEGGWPVLGMGVASVLAAVGYMGGPRPIAYTPFGELAVFVFFGLVAVCGSYYVQTGGVDAAALIAATAIGMQAAAVLLVNNCRDRAHDATTGRRTLATLVTRAAAARIYAGLVLVPFALALLLAFVAGSLWFALPLAALPMGGRLVHALPRMHAAPAQNALLFRTVLLEVAYGTLLAAGALAAGWR